MICVRRSYFDDPTIQVVITSNAFVVFFYPSHWIGLDCAFRHSKVPNLSQHRNSVIYAPNPNQSLRLLVNDILSLLFFFWDLYSVPLDRPIFVLYSVLSAKLSDYSVVLLCTVMEVLITVSEKLITIFHC